jgi:acyl CoA:acetate/3-ketoacid CoA transferase
MPGRALDKVAEKLYDDPDQQFVRGALMPFLGFSPWLQKLVTENRIECYGWPIGITAYWFREVASGRAGLITKIGLDTFLDPRREGAFLNEAGRKSALCKVSVISIEGTDYLLYQAPKPDYALIRATTADESGNLTMEDEGIRGTVLSIAQATKARPKPGMVVAQVKRLATTLTMNPRDVEIPGPLVDYVVVSAGQHHWQMATTEYDPRISYKVFPAEIDDKSVYGILSATTPKEPEKVIARRVLMELVKLLGDAQSPILVNLGIGIPAFVSSVAAEEGMNESIISVLESGPWGGVALSGANFGLALNPFAISTIPDMFSNFEGGIIDAASLGFLQVDKEGNVNPSMLPNRIFGPGGFPVIAGGSPRTYFAGLFTAGPSEIGVSNNRLRITSDGSMIKFVDNVFKVFFSGREAIKYGHEILYITERAVFRLTERGLTLEEFAPGADVDRDILAKMGFAPVVSSSLKEMDERLFNRGIMGIKEDVARKVV